MIDAHVHLWRIGENDCTWPGADLPVLYRDIMPDELWRTVSDSGVDRVVLVQSQESERDTRWLLSLAHDEPRIAGVVGWVDLAAGDAVARIDALSAAGPLVGVRPMVQDGPADWYDDAAIDAGLAHLAARGLVLDALVRPRHLPALARLAARHPRLRIVIDHAAKPQIGGDLDRWHADMRALAALPQVVCKLSGLVTEVPAERPASDAGQVIAMLMELFGAGRLLWGSDWPVLALRSDYAAWLAMARSAIPASDRDAVFGGNARRVYGLSELWE